METIEIVVYTAVGLIVAGMGLYFVLDIDAQGISQSVSKFLGDESYDSSYKKVTPPQFVHEMYLIWEACGKGERDMEKTVYVVEDEITSQITKTYIFNRLRQINYCSQLQSVSNDCGTREDVIIPRDFTLPSVIKLSCSQEGLELV